MFRISNLNNILNIIKLKKNYLKSFKKKIFLLKFNQRKVYKIKSQFNKPLVRYIISVHFSKTNTFINIKNFSGILKFFYSSGSFKYSGKSKKARALIFKNFYRLLMNKLRFLKKKPIALHLSNVGSSKYWILRKLKKRFFIKIVRNFNLYPHNGCRKKKARRKKFKKRRNG